MFHLLRHKSLDYTFLFDPSILVFSGLPIFYLLLFEKNIFFFMNRNTNMVNIMLIFIIDHIQYQKHSLHEIVHHIFSPKKYCIHPAQDQTFLRQSTINIIRNNNNNNNNNKTTITKYYPFCTSGSLAHRDSFRKGL